MIDLPIHTQPDDETCGPTCLQAVYQYYGRNFSLNQIIQEVERSYSGGTLAPLLGKHALKQGFNVTLYVNNLDVFDPTWFQQGEGDANTMIAKLEAQLQHKKDQGIVQSSLAYQAYLQMGGKIRFHTLRSQLLKNYLNQKIPIITGLSATYLYFSARECYTQQGLAYFDDIRGTPCGHFVVLCDYDANKRHVIVADPHRENPLSQDNYYKVSSQRLLNAIMLGVFTNDANLLIIHPEGI
jgi:hypothetical protein